MEKIKFSVVMPLYNKEEFVRNAIQSVLDQTYPHFELIVVDDGSKDSSADIVKTISDSRIRLIQQKNGGESVARNKGIKEAKNSFIAFLDSDDLWLPDFLETIYEGIVKYPTAGAFGCAYLHETVTENTLTKALKMQQREEFIYIKNYYDYLLTHEQGLTASSAVVKKNVFEKVGGFPVGLKNWVDLDLWARIALDYDIVFCTRICTIYNDVPNSVSKINTKLHAPVFDNYKQFIIQSGVTGEKKKDFIEYVIKSKMYSVYQQYLNDQKGVKAIRELLPYWRTKRNRKSYWSMLLQFVFTPDKILRINALRKGSRK